MATKNKDWTGDRNSLFKTLGASSHTEEEREAHDYYATEPAAVEHLLKLEKFSNLIWECACGEGHISKVLEAAGHTVKSTDLIDRGYGEPGKDFLSMEVMQWIGDIVTNPPYKYAQEFIEKSLEIVPPGYKVAMFLKLQFLESKGRKELFKQFPPKTVWVSSSRLTCAKNGDFVKMKEAGGSAISFAWFVWVKGYKGETVIKWFN